MVQNKDLQIVKLQNINRWVSSSTTVHQNKHAWMNTVKHKNQKIQSNIISSQPTTVIVYVNNIMLTQQKTVWTNFYMLFPNLNIKKCHTLGGSLFQ
jgi:hypothetical protein